jgi:hypothetical protein
VLLVVSVASLIGSAVSEVAGVSAPAVATVSYRGAQGPLVHDVRIVPVLVYHEMNDGCSASALVCQPHVFGGSSDPESVSTAQFAGQMKYLHESGYRTVTMSQYVAWIRNENAPMPSKPILLIADNGIGPFLDAAQPVLLRYHYYMTAAIITGFADGASGLCPDPSLQPGCGTQNRGWDLTWPQLRALGPEYNFILEAGRSGHFLQNYDPRCQQFYACMLPGETVASYERRVRTENSDGRTELKQQLMSRVNTQAWVAPYSDLGYQKCALADCTPQDSTGPRGWLASWAAEEYQVIFVEDAVRNGIARERFRIDVNGWMNMDYFTGLMQADIDAGDFSH